MNEDAEPASPPAPEEATVEATGETVGEAKWSALRELERLYPGIDKGRIRFAVVDEGERGLLGVGYAPARVVASAPAATAAAPEPALPPDSPAGRLRELLERICAALGVAASVSVLDEESALVARLSGPDLGLVIGRRGQTIDAIQYLANAIVWHGEEERRRIVVDAAGYRGRRQTALERTAERAAREALARDGPVALEAMSVSERKIVHLYLQERGGVVTSSEGAEPGRHVVVEPARD